MNKIDIKDLYLVFGPEKQKAFRMLKERKSKNEILKATNCTVAVKNANLTIKEGEFFVIMGLSGSGKSTLLRCINRLIKPTKGQGIVGNAAPGDSYGVPKFWFVTSSQCFKQYCIRARTPRSSQTGT